MIDVPALEQCKKMQELGILPKNAEDSDCDYIHEVMISDPDKSCVKLWNDKYFNDECSYAVPAITVDEILDIMPLTIKNESGRLHDYYYRIERSMSGHNVTYYCFMSDDVLCSFNGETLAHALADCIIWLKQNNHMGA